VAAESGANSLQVEYWNDVAGPKWVALDGLINDQIEGLGRTAIERAAPRPGEAVLDVGCGCGHSSVELAGHVGETGRVLGVDVSEPMLVQARSLARAAANLDFQVADAQTHGFEAAAFDLAFSRFGVMFFDDPQAAFANILRALRPGGRLVFVCWQEIAKNPWMAIPGAAAMQHLDPPAPPDPSAPGPFAFADRERVAGLLEAAGFSKVHHEALAARVTVGRGLGRAEILEFLVQMGPAGAAMRQAVPEVQKRIRASVAEAVTPWLTDEGMVAEALCWVVRAECPGN